MPKQTLLSISDETKQRVNKFTAEEVGEEDKPCSDNDVLNCLLDYYYDS